jgi:hypothetical protein
MSLSRSSRLLLLVSLLLPACSAEVGTADGSIASSQDPIINGTPLEENNSGIVYLSNGCSGTLITNTKVLTAKHCVEAYVGNPSGLFITMGSQSTLAADIFLHPEPFIDVAVVWTYHHLAMNGSAESYRRDIGMATAEQLDNGALIIAGYGWNTGTGGGGPDNLRWGVCSSRYRSAGRASCFPGPNGAIQSWGDSGGSGAVYAAGLPVVYVQSFCFFDNDLPYECVGDTSSAWLPWAWWYLQ